MRRISYGNERDETIIKQKEVQVRRKEKFLTLDISLLKDCCAAL